ncbi:ABC transporter permease subunit [Vibrio nigripulchritudo]|uniref:ABC transporter permease subunit n=1 Tax=Vibrio nigripulchritudo TaxID=28173 RepID=UPI0005FA299A|nr:ribose ABC transporter [Vibrio nigripulchritudo]KJY80929.1 ribose ABC transporter [Vibrio nigripulchritudo]
MSSVPSTTKAEESSAQNSGFSWLEWLSKAWPWLFLTLLLLFFEVWSQVMFDTTFLGNSFTLQSIALFAAAPLLLGIGQTFVIIAAGIDLSLGFIMGFASVIMAATMNLMPADTFIALIVGFGAALLASFIPGVINGTLIARLAIPPFIGTLGMYGVARGMGFIFADGTTVPVNNSYLYAFGNGKLLGIPYPVLLAIAVLILAHYLLSQTKFGQYTYAIGGNRNAAIRSGIKVKRQLIWVYILAALCAGLAGATYTARFSAGAAQAGEPMLLDSIAAVVIGGASLFGGYGTVIGTLIGALIIAVIQFGLVFIDVEPFWQFVAVGVVIIVSVFIDQSKSKLTGGHDE